MKISVVVPMYNAERYIQRCIRSVQNQTYGNWELIIVDDGSKDGTTSLVRQWMKEAKLDIRFIQQTNKGKFNTLVETVKLAKGEWFLIADSDDGFEPNTIEVFMNVYNKLSDNIKG